MKSDFEKGHFHNLNSQKKKSDDEPGPLGDFISLYFSFSFSDLLFFLSFPFSQSLVFSVLFLSISFAFLNIFKINRLKIESLFSRRLLNIFKMKELPSILYEICL